MKTRLKYLKLEHDGCTNSPDGWWLECCAEHDFYYRNKVDVTRFKADWYLYKCMMEKRAFITGTIYFLFVRVMGWRYFRKEKSKFKTLEKKQCGKFGQQIAKQTRLKKVV